MAVRAEPLEPRMLLAVTTDPMEPEFRVNTVLSGQSVDPDVAVDADGDSVIVWTRIADDQSTLTVMGQMYDRAGVPRGVEFVVNNAGTFAANPVVTMDKSGGFVVAWVGGGTVQPGIYARRFSVNAVPYTLQFRVNELTGNPGPGLDARDVAIASNDRGDFVVAWPEAPAPTTAFQTVRARRFDVRLDPLGDSFRVDTSDDQAGKTEVSAAMDADGDFVIAWRGLANNGSGLEEIAARRFNRLGQPQGDDFRVDEPNARQPRFRPSVDMAPDGRFVVVWMDTGDDAQPADTVRGRRYDAAGTPRGGVEWLFKSLRAFSTSSGPDVVVGNNGGFIVAADQNIPDTTGGPGFTTNNTVVLGQYDADGNFLGQDLQYPTDEYSAGNLGFVALDAEEDLSDAVLTWHRTDGATLGDNDVYAIRMFDTAVAADPDPGPEPVNTPPTSTGLANVDVAQDAPSTAVALFDAFADAQDADPDLRYRVISNNNANLFSSITVDPLTGLLMLDYAPGQSGTATLIVQATDLASASVESTFTVNVRGSGTPPPPPGPGPGGEQLPSLAGPHALGGRLFQKLVIAGKRKARKAPAAGVHVFVDANDDGVRNANEPAATSGADGSYAFSGIAAGRYRVRPLDAGSWQVVTKKGFLKPTIVKPNARKPAKVKPLMLLAIESNAG